ncbi:amino acid adenylation domain-containing protein, partial [Kitasatospora sp. NPDC093558]|uniref:amino acid adenylation domain-containing protein n=1 Tax=Kitasatospora sp. NPDC093558 TaxID=3155201 RepID=UPI00341F2331
RNLDLIPTLLGILKSGAAYLPLDPVNPDDRLAYITTDANSTLVITNSTLAERVAGFTDTPLLLLDDPALTTAPEHEPTELAGPDNLIYVIYTSGSTGKPKGVTLTHTNVLRHFEAAREQLGFSAADVVTQAHSYAFDVSVWEMWGALLHGGRLVIVPAELGRSPQDFLDLLVEQQVTVLLQTPTAFRSLTALAADGDPRIDRIALRLVAFGGERLEPAELQPWTTRPGAAAPALLNLYGPTETTMHAAYHRLTPADLARAGRSVIGRPLPDLRIHLLDPSGQLVPVGVPGEIAVGGPAVARGYLDRPGLTAERFVPDPFGPAGSRLYRTGDLARRLDDGSLEYLGRIDSQVKVRGYRIELGEIETALRDHHGVREAVVIAVAERLVAYMVAEGTLDPAAVRTHLSATLPEYMIPAAYVAIDRVPLTVNGKLDTRALPAPDDDAFTSARYTAPRTPVEERLAAIWSDVLGTDRVGVEDSFFDLGGDSIRAVRLVGALRAAGYDASVRDVFQHRTIAELAAHLGGRADGSLITAVEPFTLISAEDRALLPDDVVDAYPLSQIQTGMLVEMLAANEAGGHLYQNINSFRIPDDRDFSLTALKQAVDTVVARHDVLRTSMHLSGYSQPLQLVHATADLPVAQHDWRDLDPAELDRARREFATSDRAAGFDLTTAPLMRIAALLEEGGAWRLTIGNSHAITEGWTLHSLMMEIVGCYQALRDGRELPEHQAPSVRYADYVAAELDSLADPEDQAFWQRITAEHVPFALPATWADAPGTAAAEHGVKVPFADLEAGLRRLAVGAKASLKSVLLAAHLKVLSSLTAEDAFHTGVVYHGRLEAPGADQVLGMHLNTVPFPATRPSGTWRQLVEQVYAREAEIWTHRRYPLPAIQRDTGTTQRLVTTMFDHQNFHQVDTDTVDTAAGLNEGGNEFALTTVATDRHIELATGTQEVSRENLRRLASMYRLVLESMAADPDGPAAAAQLPAAERELLLTEWNTATEHPVDGFVHDVFAAHAAGTPDAVALTFGDESLTYAEVDERANRLAHQLRALGAGPDLLVGVSLERDLDLVPTLLGVLKSGAAYLPLDPTNPADRLAYILDDAQAPILITRTEHLATYDGIYDGRLVVLDADADRTAIAARPATAPDPVGARDALMYVIYTSGSTGKPKGVALSHANVLRMFAAVRTGMGFTRDDVVTQSHSYAFDFSVWEMWGALLHGARLVIVPPEVSRSPEDLADLLVAQRVTVLCQIPSAFRALAAMAGAGDDRIDRLNLRTVVFGGEKLETAELRPWLGRTGLDRTALVNLYGPTEITVHCTFHRLGADDLEQPARSRLGHRLDDTRIHLLDANRELMPVGVPGEIYVGGPGLARGYLNRPGLTAERFVPDPFGPAGSRLYRTGDLARRLDDGTLEYLGRVDSQVKVRGYRIELGEIEARLREHPAVRQAVVTAPANEDGERSLVAYVVGPDRSPDATAELREHLGATLPGYMVPAAFMMLDALPLISGGKVNYRALPAPDRDAFGHSRYVAPRTPVEERLAAIWTEVLGIGRISVEDSFFDLGGDSLRAVRLVGAMRNAGYDVSIPEVFQRRTIAALGARLGGGTGESLITAVEAFALIGAEDRALLPDDVVDAYPLSQIQTGMLAETLAAGDEGRAIYHNLNSFRIRDDRPFSLPALQEAVDTVVARHDILRTSMHLSGYSQPLQLVHGASAYPVTIRDVRGLDTEEQNRLKAEFIAVEHAVVFELTTAPLLHISALLEDETAWRLNFTYHHAISEGWSYNALMMEIVESYQALRDGRELPHYQAPSVRYADFIAAELASLASEDDQTFWRGVVDDHAPLRLPAAWAQADRPAGERHGVQVPFGDLDEKLRQLALGANTSLKSVLLAAHLKVMSMLTADDAFHTGVVFHGRLEAPGADRVLGMHLNTLPFPATRPSGTWRQLVEQVYAQEAEIWAHRRYPLPAIQHDAGNSRQLLSVLFEYLDFHHVDTETVDVAEGLADGINEFALNVIPTRGNVNLGTTTAVLSATALARLGAMYRSVLEAMATDPDGDAAAAHLPEDARQPQHGTVTEPTTLTTLDVFQAQATATPQAIAVISGDEQWTYQELDAHSSRLAHHLHRNGVTPGSIVGVSLDRTPHVLAAMLAVWKAGAAYVPVDPTLPAERRAYMLTGTAALITESTVTDPGYDGPHILLDTDVIPEHTGVAPEFATDPDALAYVLYTSGSTGRPKGVMIPHRALHNLLTSVRDDIDTGHAGAWLASTSISFDISGLELFLPLTTGGQVVLAGNDQAKDPEALVDLIDTHQVTHIQLTPSGWRLLLTAGFHNDTITALIGGEACTPDLANELLGHVHRLVNVYGPTETTIWSTYWEVPEEAHTIAIGTPLANTSTHILDSNGRPVADGVPGELHLGGTGLAHGYHDRPDLTAERFVPNPHDPAGTRLYRTGDLARRLDDGTLEYLGRIDNQVKIRGYRIELGEIETALRTHPSVREAVVTAPAQQLVAYLVTEGTLDPAALRTHLSASLPDYMLPTAYVTIDRIPLTNSGKVDHRALPTPDTNAYTTTHHTAPRTPLEERLAAIWSDVLGTDQLGIDDSFFDLGGDSIRAVRLVGALRAAGYDASVRDVFQHRTIAALGAQLGHQAAGHSLITAVEPFTLISAEDRALLPDDATDAYPLSQIQTGMLVEMLAASEAGGHLYQNINSFRIPDNRPFFLPALQQAIDAVADRHDVLRTSMHLGGYSQPLQLVHAGARIEAVLYDWRDLDPAELDRARREFVAADRAAGFELATAPMLRVAVHLESDDAWRLTFAYHHAIAEGWTVNTLAMELVESYQAMRDGRELPDYQAPSVRYADYIAAELASLANDEDRAFWQRITSGRAPLQLPDSWADETDGTTARCEQQVPFTDLEAGLRRLAVGAKASLKSVLLAAHLKVLGSLTPEDAFHTGVVHHGRLEAPGADRVLGMHLNTVPFPASRPAGTWRQLVEEVYAQEAEIWAHRRYPLPAIQRDTGTTQRLVTTMFDHQNFHQVDTDTVDTGAGLNEGGNEFALSAIAANGRIALSTTTAVIGSTNLARLASMYRSVLEAMATDPEGSASAAHLPEGETALLAEWNATTAFPTDTTVHRAFAAQAARTPDAVALQYGDRTLTYAELDTRANQLAHHLRTLGAGPETLVGLCLERNLDLIPTLLGILKSGAAYLPLDPVNPDDRLGHIISDADATIVITNSTLAERVAGFTDTPLLLLDDPALTAAPEHEPTELAGPDNLIYTIYTSGSTGKPKGVTLTHTNALRLFASAQQHYGFNSDDVWPLFHSYAFDVSVWEMWGALLHGGRLVVVPASMTRTPDEFLDVLVASGATILCQTPTAFRSLAALAGDGDPRTDRLALRAVVFAGERLELTELRPWTDRYGFDRPALINMYGITETTVHSTYHQVRAADLERTDRNPVGIPLADTAFHLLDALGRPVPVGVPGEIHVAGPAVARGYLNRPDLTAERFLPNPYGPAGSRMYRSGDQARRLTDGTLDFLGRIDKQVKIRGYRIELGEIETALRDHPTVREAVVTAHTERLVAYVVSEEALDPAALRTHLSASLPDYMVPAAYVAIDHVPLTVNGKLDTRALPAPDDDAYSTARYVAPRTPLEERLAAIWSELLGRPQVGVDDNFFDLGGDSIRAVRVLAAAQEAGIPLTVWMILQARSLAELAQLAEAGGDTGRGIEDGVPLLPAQLARLSAATTGAQTVRLPLSGPADAALLDQALRAVARHHEALRLRYPAEGDGDLARPYELGAEPLVHELDLTATAADERPAAIARALAEAGESSAPVLATLVRVESAGELWLTVDGLALDRASWPIVLGDLNSAYRQYAAGRPVPRLAPVATPLHGWARAVAERAGSAEVLDQAGFWLNRPDGAELPVDRAGGPQAPGTVATVTAALPAGPTEVLLADPNPEHLLLGTLARTLARWAGSDRMDLDVTVDPRHAPEQGGDLSRTVGRLADEHPVSLRLPKGADAAASLTSVSRQLRSLPVPRGGYGMLRHLAPEPGVAEELAALRPPQVGFAFTRPAEQDADPALVFVPERVVPTGPAGAAGDHLLEVEADVCGGQLFLRWTYRTALHDEATVRRLLDEQVTELEGLLRQGTGSTATGSKSAGPTSAGSKSTGPDAADEIEAVLARHGIPGASLAWIEDGRTVAVRAFGVVDVAGSEPVTPETVFAAGSISKHVTTVAALRLASDGLLDLDRDLNDYLSEWRLPTKPGHPATARMLLSNLGGFADRPQLDDGYHRHDVVPSLLDVLHGRAPARTPAVELAHRPGTEFRQNSLNFAVLQQAMTELTGESYQELTRRLVFEPLGMTGSSFDPRWPDAGARAFARGHDADGRQVSDGYYVNPEPAAGGLWTTAADLAALATELRRCYLGRRRGLVATELVREMLTPQSGRAYGWSTILDTTGGDVEFGHGGQAHGYQAMTWMRVHSGRGLVMLSNAAAGRELIRHLIATELSGRTKLAADWQRAIEEAVGRERGGAA